MIRYLVGDVETTGVEESDRTVEVAWIEVDAQLNELNRVYSLIDPQMPIGPSAMGVHHITNEMVADAPTWQELFEQVIPNHFAKDDEIVLVAHNAQFDQRFLKLDGFMPIKEEVCTLRLARYFWPDAPDHKLQTLRYLHKLVGGEGAHGAMEDCETGLALLRFMCQSYGISLNELCFYTRQPLLVTRMYYGKHKGSLLKDIPRGYRVWLLGTDLDEDLRYSLENL
ncbi:3'-5' exonuclease [Ferribacterium limneticum]|uniref:3'-5' exonuclease n=1 Tax=Ferribacterium limneticum TaxID=76259 RepID=UPI001CF86094|nr:3'-5' exonuclease [Ferribacterium limneticum]UCV26719.1 hypothetical protein KI617_10400 [Ferribacterium limneticum]UCV30636.1 hypothetical protein KI608_10400 [Ferribacterium limneticum]